MVHAQEICNDGLDNDGDGLVDCADPDCKDAVGCEGAFACVEGLYQVLSGQLNIFDPAALTYTPIGPTNPSYNGTGYNIKDGYIYGQRDNEGERELLKIRNDGTIEVLGIVTGGTEFASWKADFDGNGNLVIYQNQKLYYIDVAQTAPFSFTTVNLTNTTGTSWPNNADIVYNYVYGKFYLMTSGRELWEIDETAATITMIADLDTELSGSTGGFGAAWADGNGMLYFFNNSSGNISYVELSVAGDTVVEAGLLVTSTPNGSNDGMSCPLARIPEICGNGVDDDGDGLIDCDDPDCVAYVDCVYTESTGGGGSGFESNNRLADKIAKRNYSRTLNNEINVKVDIPSRKINRGAFAGVRNGDVTAFIPVDAIPNTQTYTSTPTDIVELTNAIDVYSVDYFQDNARVASILATESENGVYEHTKYICDRLQGSILEDIWKYKLDDDNEYIVSKYQQPDGIIEYSTTISFFKGADNQYRLESHWNLVDYPANSEYYTFQLWANNMLNLEFLVGEMLGLIENDAPIQSYNLGQIPNLYVRNARYENHILTMDIVNASGATSLTIDASALETELATDEIRQFVFPLTGEMEQTLTLDTEGVYAMGLSFHHENETVADAIYMADGVWGLDYGAGASINEYEVSTNTEILNPDDRLIERNINFRAEVTEYVGLYRSMNAAYTAEDLSAYNALSFFASGQGMIEVTLVKESVSDWLEQPRTYITLDADGSEFDLSIADFNSILGLQDWSDIKMLVFTMASDGQTPVDFELNLADVRFRDASSTSTFETIYGQGSLVMPNPVVDEAQLLFEVEQDTGFDLSIYSVDGKLIHSDNGIANAGKNSYTVLNNDYQSGLYFYEINTDNGQKMRGKIIFTNL